MVCISLGGLLLTNGLFFGPGSIFLGEPQALLFIIIAFCDLVTVYTFFLIVFFSSLIVFVLFC